MTRPATLKGTVTGPDQTGDYLFEFTDELRGPRRIPIHPTTSALTIGSAEAGSADEAPTIAPDGEVPAVLGPGTNRRKLCDYLRSNGVTFPSSASTEQLTKLVKEHLDKQKAGAST